MITQPGMQRFLSQFDKTHGSPAMAKETTNVDEERKEWIATNPTGASFSHCVMALDANIGGVAFCDKWEGDRIVISTMSNITLERGSNAIAGKVGAVSRPDLAEVLTITNKELKGSVVAAVSKQAFKESGLQLEFIDVDLCEGKGLPSKKTDGTVEMIGKDLPIPMHIEDYNAQAEPDAKQEVVLVKLPTTMLLGQGDGYQVPGIETADDLENIMRDHGPAAELWLQGVTYLIDQLNGQSVHKYLDKEWDWDGLLGDQQEKWKLNLKSNVTIEPATLRAHNPVATKVKHLAEASFNHKWKSFLEDNPDIRKEIREEEQPMSPEGSNTAGGTDNIELVQQMGDRFKEAADALANSNANDNDKAADKDAQLSAKAHLKTFLVQNNANTLSAPLELAVKDLPEGGIQLDLIKNPNKEQVHQRLKGQLSQFRQGLQKKQGSNGFSLIKQMASNEPDLNKAEMKALGMGLWHYKQTNLYSDNDLDAPPGLTLFSFHPNKKGPGNSDATSTKLDPNFNVKTHEDALGILANAFVVLEFLNRKQEVQHKLTTDGSNSVDGEAFQPSTYITKIIEMLMDAIAEAGPAWYKEIMDQSNFAWLEIVRATCDIISKIAETAASTDLEREEVVKNNKAPPNNLVLMVQAQTLAKDLYKNLNSSITQNNANMVATAHIKSTFTEKVLARQNTQASGTDGDATNPPSGSESGPGNNGQQTRRGRGGQDRKNGDQDGPKKSQKAVTVGGLFYSDKNKGGPKVPPATSKLKINMNGEDKMICIRGSTCGLICTYANCTYAHLKSKQWINGEISNQAKTFIRSKYLPKCENLVLVKKIASLSIDSPGTGDQQQTPTTPPQAGGNGTQTNNDANGTNNGGANDSSNQAGEQAASEGV